ncbi:hypothetical protein SYYSPA8_25490 [Streptomyces yaizuensis]|uniref:UDP-glucose/GDP-mannose dehydrogenase N-terminal domain-containing protein n=1 Tax=Streptomyces yaizuensis TaxID=2989713 RepID=A0ABQ5P5A0_9ACTN|nr:hypothetical protein SYYSPA8_25490 [Streptomyces sp. YSPA8]
MHVVVAGQGYVGLPLAVRAAEVGHRVVGYDVDDRRIRRLTVGDSYVEDVSAERLRPLRDGVPDLSYVESSARLLAQHLRPGPPWCWSPPPTRAPPRNCSPRCWKRAPV